LQHYAVTVYAGDLSDEAEDVSDGEEEDSMLCSTSDDAEPEDSDENSSQGAVEGHCHIGDQMRPMMLLPFDVNGHLPS
jgi:hypothetical protein